MDEIFDFLDRYDVEFCWINKKSYGKIYPARDLVKINVRLMVIETLLHEFYHDKYPSLSEVAVERLAVAKTQSLTVDQIHEIVDELAKGG